MNVAIKNNLLNIDLILMVCVVAWMLQRLQ